MSTDPLIPPSRAEELLAEMDTMTIPQANKDAMSALIAEADEKCRTVARQIADDLKDRDCAKIGTQARDEFLEIESSAVLITDALRAGRITAKEARRQLEVLRVRHAQQSRRRASFEAMSKRIEDIDADPLAAGRKLAEKNTALWIRLP